jgi:GMP synthase (glutamine-hydrolysing)
MSHGDSVQISPDDPHLNVLARTAEGTIAAIKVVHTPWVGVQFHPEVVQTLNGKLMLQCWLDTCGAKKDWAPSDAIEEIRRGISLYSHKRIIVGYSGGVDSSLLCKIMVPVMGKNLLGVCIDGGQLRDGELDEIRRSAEIIGLELQVVQAEDRFLEALKGTVNDGERKRACFSETYRMIFEEAADRFGPGGALIVAQGSLAPDFIESGQHEGAHSATIKTHHNMVKFSERFSTLHPLMKLFKYEVRDMARVLGLPDYLVNRQPFPGPGLFIRIVGGEVTAERLDTTRWIDSIVTRITKESGDYDKISQLVNGLQCTPSVGVKGDGRAYAGSALVRGVKSEDYMTADGYELPVEVRRIIRRELGKHPHIARTFFCEDDKPHSTIEFE